VIDTNVWLDLFVFDDPAARPLRRALDARAAVALRSDATDAELPRVLARPHFAARCSSAQAAALLAAWQALALPATAAQPAPWACRDPDDQKFLDLACSAGASALLTKDRALLALARKARLAGLQILAPAAYRLPAVAQAEAR